MSDPTVKQRKPRRRLAPSEKYEMFVAVLTEQSTQREAAARWDVDRTAVVHTCRVAKQGASDALAAAVPGRPGQTAEAIQLAELRHEVQRLRSTATEQAVALHLHEGKSVLGLSAGPVPSRVDADTKAGLLVLIDRAESAGWSTRRAAGLLGVDLDRVARWRARQRQDRLTDAHPGKAGRLFPSRCVSTQLRASRSRLRRGALRLRPSARTTTRPEPSPACQQGTGASP